MIEITGTIINYYVHCKKQCYLFANKICMEHNSTLVEIGKAIHEEKAKTSKNTEVSIEHIKIDKIGEKYITEIKKSDADIEASLMQLKYYIYVLRKKGIEKDGKLEIIEKTKEHKEIIVKNEDVLDIDIEKTIKDIHEFLDKEMPIVEMNKKCLKCAYYEYCVI